MPIFLSRYGSSFDINITEPSYTLMRLGGDFFSLMISPSFLPTIKTSPPTIVCESNGAPGASMNRVTNKDERELLATPGVLLVVASGRLTPDIQLHPCQPEAATLHEPLDVGRTWAVALRALSKANRQNIGTYRMASPLDSFLPEKSTRLLN